MEVEKISKKGVDRKISTHAWLKHFTQSCNNRELIKVGFLCYWLQRTVLPSGPKQRVPASVWGPAIRMALRENLSLAAAVVAKLYHRLNELSRRAKD